MTRRHASCSCGQLALTAEGEPLRVSVCHCLECQRRSGSVFAVQARFPADAVATSGQASTYARTGDEGTSCTFHFCPRCGTTVYFVPDAIPGVVSVPVGAFADPDFPAPRAYPCTRRAGTPGCACPGTSSTSTDPRCADRRQRPPWPGSQGGSAKRSARKSTNARTRGGTRRRCGITAWMPVAAIG